MAAQRLINRGALRGLYNLLANRERIGDEYKVGLYVTSTSERSDGRRIGHTG